MDLFEILQEGQSGNIHDSTLREQCERYFVDGTTLPWGDMAESMKSGLSALPGRFRSVLQDEQRRPAPEEMAWLRNCLDKSLPALESAFEGNTVARAELARIRDQLRTVCAYVPPRGRASPPQTADGAGEGGGQ